MSIWIASIVLFFFNDTATTEIYTLSLHDALPISARGPSEDGAAAQASREEDRALLRALQSRSEEHTSELQSLAYLVCRLLLEKKNEPRNQNPTPVFHLAPLSTVLVHNPLAYQPTT